MSSGLPRSVQTRLVRHAAEIAADPNLVLARYGAERFLYRLSKSRHADRFILKGALLLLLWLGETIRATRDADLLGRGDFSDTELTTVVRDVCMADVEPDGLTSDTASIRIEPIRLQDDYGGKRISVVARLGPARIPIQVDVGVGDAVVPPPAWADYPSLIDMPKPHIRVYQPATVVAEKMHAMVKLGEVNSRMRDVFDVHALATALAFDGTKLVKAIAATFERRATPLPKSSPLALTPAFARVEGKQAQWSAFIRKSRASNAPSELSAVISSLARFAGPPLVAAASKEPFVRQWTAGGPWESAS
jgi:hypothetical protein